MNLILYRNESVARQKCNHFKIFHRIDINFIIKVADFGLSESMYSATYFRQEKDRTVKLPVKWLSPEALTEGIFSEKSDVVSYNAMRHNL